MKGRIVRDRAASRDSGFYRAWTTMGLFLMLGAALLLASCGGGEQPSAEDQAEENPSETAPAANEEPESAGRAIGVSVADIVDDPSEFYSKQLTVSGLISEVVAPNAVTIGGQDGIFEEELLIVGAQPLPELAEGEEVEIAVDDLVQATGTLQEFRISEFEESLDTSFDDQLFATYEGEPALQASSVALTPAQGGGTTNMQQGIEASIPTIVDDPTEFYGSTTTVSGVVGETVEPSAFVILDQDTASGTAPEDFVKEGLLVVSGGGGDAPNLTESQTVRVSGTVQEFDLAAFEDELGADLNDELYTAWDGRPAILADSIQQMQGETTMQQ